MSTPIIHFSTKALASPVDFDLPPANRYEEHLQSIGQLGVYRARMAAGR